MPNDPLVYAGVCRFTVHGHFGGVQVANVLDMHIDSQNGSNRGDNILDQAKVIVDNWANHMMQVPSNTYTADRVSWVDLNSVDGETGETAEGTAHNFPASGGYPNAALPANVALVITKQVASARGKRKGRLFMVGLPESYTLSDQPNVVDPTYITNTQGHVNSFLSGINQSAGIGGGNYDSELVVCHTTSHITDGVKVIEAAGFTHVDALHIENHVHSQRRRLG
jgi:hypothetical protein